VPRLLLRAVHLGSHNLNDSRRHSSKKNFLVLRG
jgi:hypothetical protein